MKPQGSNEDDHDAHGGADSDDDEYEGGST